MNKNEGNSLVIRCSWQFVENGSLICHALVFVNHMLVITSCLSNKHTVEVNLPRIGFVHIFEGNMRYFFW